MTNRDKTLADLVGKGWKNDETAVRWARSVKDWVQDTDVWVRDAAHGGQWKLTLDYNSRERYGCRDDRLRSAYVSYIEPDAKMVKPGLGNEGDDRIPLTAETSHPFGDWGYSKSLVIKNPGRYDHETWLWDATNPTTGKRSLRDRVALFADNPDLAVWAAGVIKRQHDTDLDNRVAAQREDQELRARRLPVTVSQECDRRNPWTDPVSEWWTLAQALKESAVAVAAADGKSDLYALVREVEDSLAAVKSVLIEEPGINPEQGMLGWV